jgi:beta-phosphoglucomutase-like phosphatase (HAD superfamily)
MPIEAVIYDMDGVLVDSEPYWKRSRVEFAADLGKVWTDADQRACMGRNTIEWAHTMRERLDPPMSADEIIEDMLRRMTLKYEENLPRRPIRSRWRRGRPRCSSAM